MHLRPIHTVLQRVCPTHCEYYSTNTQIVICAELNTRIQWMLLTSTISYNPQTEQNGHANAALSVDCN